MNSHWSQAGNSIFSLVEIQACGIYLCTVYVRKILTHSHCSALCIPNRWVSRMPPPLRKALISHLSQYGSVLILYSYHMHSHSFRSLVKFTSACLCQYPCLLPSPHSFPASYIICTPVFSLQWSGHVQQDPLPSSLHFFNAAKRNEKKWKKINNRDEQSWILLLYFLKSPDFSQEPRKEVFTGTGITYSTCEVRIVRYFSKIFSSKITKRHDRPPLLMFINEENKDRHLAWNPAWLLTVSR